jgi:hypothetical protein
MDKINIKHFNNTINKFFKIKGFFVKKNGFCNFHLQKSENDLLLQSRRIFLIQNFNYRMFSNSLFDKLDLSDDKNLLIQGLPSSIEKQFAKLSYAKNVTPLLKSRKIDFALVFAVNRNQLSNILKDVFPALHKNSKLWVAYPKVTSKIASDLNRNTSWDALSECEYEAVNQVTLDHVWSAMLFKKCVVETTPKILKSKSKSVLTEAD